MNQHSVILALTLVIVILSMFLVVKHSGENYRFNPWTDCTDEKIIECEKSEWAGDECRDCENMY